jgi:hypothetical protein
MASFLKKILKAVFPVLLLKQLFLLYNKFRILTIDRLLFPEHQLAKEEFQLYRTGYPFRENNIDVADITDETVRAHMNKWYDWTQEEFVLKFNKTCLIEPDYGWAIVGRRLLYYSLGISRTPFLPKPRFFRFLFFRNVQSLSSAISLRDTGEENYFHFYNDIITKLYLLKENHISIENKSIIISRKLWDKPYFQFYLSKNILLRELNWVIQDKQYIQVKQVLFCKSLTHPPLLLKKIFTPLSVKATFSKRIFVTRNKNRSRYLSNSTEVEELFSSLGFTIVDTDRLSIEMQIQCFANAEFIAGIHGAGLTNIAFREAPCKVLEIFPYPAEGYLPFHYIMLAKMKKFFYQAIVGEKSKSPYQNSFFIDVEKLKRAIQCMT